MQARDFLLEIGTEELPSAPLMKATAQFEELFTAKLRNAELAFGATKMISTPRRMAIIIRDVALETEEKHEEYRGPSKQIAFDAEGNPTKAALGFARGKGATADDLEIRVDADGKEYVFVTVDTPARQAQDILAEISQEVISELSWPRSQRWATHHETFCRPVRWICCLYGEDVIPVEFAGVVSGHTTLGHRILASGQHTVASPNTYEQVLESHGVLGHERRRELICDGIKQIENTLGVRVETPKKILDEVVNLCEWPTVLVGKFDEEFLDVPHEIITESMLSNQRYFPVYDRQGNLTSSFIIVSNADPAVSDTVIDGNERVVRARLYDAKFFYEEDLKQPLDAYIPKLEKVTFQEKLGSVADKTNRMETLAVKIAEQAGLSADAKEDVSRAAHLAKADLVTQAVIEFTSQQGVMGAYYAQAQGEKPAVVQAIRDQYRPRFAQDELPQQIEGMCVACADKLDTICGMFAINEPPTGSKDPFAQRRSAIGILAMLQNMPTCKLADLIACSLDTYQAQGLSFDKDATAQNVAQFFAGRLATMAKDDGIQSDVIEAISSIGVIDPEDFFARAHALTHARDNQPELFADLASAYTRAAHLADASLGVEVNTDLLQLDAETNLYQTCVQTQKRLEQTLSQSNFDSALQALSQLKDPIDAFFTDVLVMDDDENVRINRLRLLNMFVAMFEDIANIAALAK